jgi:hypothetical protein
MNLGDVLNYSVKIYRKYRKMHVFIAQTLNEWQYMLMDLGFSLNLKQIIFSIRLYTFSE